MLSPLVLLLSVVLSAVLGAILMWVYYQQTLQRQFNDHARLMAESYANKKLLSEKNAEMEGYMEEMRMQQHQLMLIHSDRAKYLAELEASKRRIADKEAEFGQLQHQMKLEFEKMSQTLLDQKVEKLTTTNQEKLGEMLHPLKEKITQFEKRVEDTYNQEARERFHLQKELASLVQLNQQLSHEAHSLTRALKGENKIQGNWGEMILTKILESCGLREGEEFIVQTKDILLQDENGKRLQPDIIVQLPDKRHLIIDAKVSLTAYEQAVNVENEIDRHSFMRKHVDSIVQHIQGLSSKHYDSLGGLFSPDFVLMFLPLESAFSAAVGFKQDIFQYAFERKIVIVSPTTLLATLKTVASIWKLEHQNRNAAEIARQGGLLYDKFVTFTEEIEKIGKSLHQATDSYENALHRLTTGRDSLLNRAEKLKELGVKSNKQFSPILAEGLKQENANGNGNGKSNGKTHKEEVA